MMSSKTFNEMQDSLGIADELLALAFDTPLKNLRNWKSGAWPIPGTAAYALRLLTMIPREELPKYLHEGIRHTTFFKKKRRKQVADKKLSDSFKF